MYILNSPDLKNISGVYALINLKDKSKLYVGYSSNIYKRMKQHITNIKTYKSKNKKRYTKQFTEDFNSNDFIVDILEKCPLEISILKEYDWIVKLKPYYNKQIVKQFPNIISLKDQRRFWNKVDIKENDRCWNFRYKHSINKYGRFVIDKKNYSSNRIAYYLSYGPYHPAWKVLHSCNNKRCCNPAHLRLGTDKENIVEYYSRIPRKPRKKYKYPRKHIKKKPRIGSKDYPYKYQNIVIEGVKYVV